VNNVKNTASPRLGKFGELMVGKDLRKIAGLAGAARSIIVIRTSKGLGESGQAMPPYKRGETYYAPVSKRPAGYPMPSGGRTTGKDGEALKSVAFDEGYGQYKGAIGRGSKAQLNVSGQMLGDIQIATPNPRLAVLYFGSRKEAAKAHGHEFGTTVPRRSFFGISDMTSARAIELEALRLMKEAAKSAKLLLEGK
jgi:hypothetical protein